MVCQFLLYNKVNQLYIYIYPRISSLLRLHPTLPMPPLQVVTKHQADLPVLCSCFPLAIYFTIGSVYMSMPLSHFVISLNSQMQFLTDITTIVTFGYLDFSQVFYMFKHDFHMINSQQICSNVDNLKSGHTILWKLIYMTIHYKCSHIKIYKYTFLLKILPHFPFFYFLFIHFTWLIQIHRSEFSLCVNPSRESSKGWVSLPGSLQHAVLPSVMILAIFYHTDYSDNP